ncbi:MAG TPA: hypothetical protein PLU72_02155 [Candidatus Ozemobacteraceae bacterium]|nr:hypothetical protein [Candidatus Ozemobacteraceae bacterium]HQG26951.1 hypothetical protein [Candidatus Ozemobacteraceae bacterium]
MNRRALSFVEVIIAMGILAMCMLPVMTMFGSSGRAVLKSQNLAFAVGLAHRISQHLFDAPYEAIVEVPLPGNAIAGGPDDGFFNPLLNDKTTGAGALRITQAQLPELWMFLRKYDFRYSLIVNNVNFATGDQMKCVGIIITWKEGGKDLLYKLYTYVPDL